MCPRRFAVLGSGDILMIDTRHSVKLGSEVNQIVPRLLPLLVTGVQWIFT
jgi:hypothetical protein